MIENRKKGNIEGVKDSLSNTKHTLLKTSNSIGGFAQKNIVTSINIQEQDQRFHDVKQGGGLLGFLRKKEDRR